jgi:hypothetical protein
MQRIYSQSSERPARTLAFRQLAPRLVPLTESELCYLAIVAILGPPKNQRTKMTVIPGTGTYEHGLWKRGSGFAAAGGAPE